MSTESLFDRRAMLSSFGSGLAGIALGTLLGELEAKAAPAGGPHFAPKAKRVLEIFCPGGVSHMDTWDYKPALEKYHGQPMPGEEHAVSFQGPNGNLMKSPWGFTSPGEVGQDGHRPVPAPGRTGRRHGLRPLDDLQEQHPRAGLHVHEHRLRGRRFSGQRRLGQLRAGQS